MRRPLSFAGETPPEVPLFTGDINAAMRLMNRKQAQEIGGRLSYPGKMDCPAWGIPARRCRIGAILAQQEGSTCADCYARKGTFRFKTTEVLLEANYQKLFNPDWAPAIAAQILWEADDRFRWFVAGDLQGQNHLLNIIQVCRATRRILHWLPTREAEVVGACRDEIPDNLTIRLSATMIDGPAPAWWPTTSTVVTDPDEATCPSSVEGGNCGSHDCTACWDQDVASIAYLRH